MIRTVTEYCRTTQILLLLGLEKPQHFILLHEIKVVKFLYSLELYEY